MAPTGALGVAIAFSRAFNSLANSGPAQATGANLATPWVEAWARCAVPKASITKISQSLA